MNCQGFSRTLTNRATYLNRRQSISEISGNQIVRASASADIDLGCSSTYQITVGVERVQKARFIGAGIRLNASQCILVYKK